MQHDEIAYHHPTRQRREPVWPQWLMLVVLAFISAESALVAVVFKGAWLALLAPAIACGLKASDVWRALRGS